MRERNRDMTERGCVTFASTAVLCFVYFVVFTVLIVSERGRESMLVQLTGLCMVALFACMAGFSCADAREDAKTIQHV